MAVNRAGWDFLKRGRVALPSVLAISATLLGAVGAMILTFTQKEQADSQRYAEMKAYDLVREQQVEAARLKQSQQELLATTKALQASFLQAARKKGIIQYAQGLSPTDRQALDSVVSGQADLDKRLSALEGALSQSPDKAVALPLLKQQITDMQDRNRGDIDTVHGEIERLYTMMQWFLGLMITLIIGAGGLILSNLKQRSEKAAPSANATAKT